ncbi:hypothetical protein [Vibrio coralliilyticus]|uniref:hypothetical protein n=1 Tax=Vibrio coralliilyticus TaxID=190893 RepID=UPI001E370586|nr:hypothetical protein [Vibrio coralliilyticus]MCC2524388.1 hypothetical protein [Vibrio coralliilyticus]
MDLGISYGDASLCAHVSPLYLLGTKPSGERGLTNNVSPSKARLPPYVVLDAVTASLSCQVMGYASSHPIGTRCPTCHRQ